MREKRSAKRIAYVAMGVALTAVCAWISIPLPSMVPFTLQTFAVCLTAALLGAREGLWTVGCYLLLGAAGAPVFSGFRGGAAVLLGATGGYMVGFLFTALIVGLAGERWGRRPLPLSAAMAAGILVCYAFGTAWFMFVYARNTGAIGILTALQWCVIPYLIPDGVKIALATALAVRLRPLIGRGGTR